MKILYAIFIFSVFLPILVKSGNLYPEISQTRELIFLDGYWKFSLANTTSSETESLSGNPNDLDLHLMTVPASYNDILTSLEGRDYVGSVKYERSFLVPRSWIANQDSRIWLRFGSVCLTAEAYVNGELAVTHTTGHLPFKADITSLLTENENTISVIVTNNLTDYTIPQGRIQRSSGGQDIMLYEFDFYHYAGIDRPVVLYRTPNIYIDDIDIATSIDGRVSYQVAVEGSSTDQIDYKISILDQSRTEVASDTGSVDGGTISGASDIPNANLWWPILMSDNAAYLYILRVELSQSGVLIDTYDQHFGIREITYNNDTVLINGKRLYFRGINKHEDADVRGKALDLPMILRDQNLLRWLAVNGYRTSHYPYAEEIMDFADKYGFMIIDEVPSGNTDIYSDELQANHKQAFTELYQRDKNRPSVVMWSVSNEPNTLIEKSVDYFGEIVKHVKSFDTTRPVTLTNYRDIKSAKNVFQHLDVVSVNRYQGWYINTGDPKAVSPEIVKEITEWRELYGKPVLLTEYGADTPEGIHQHPSYVGSEEYQLDVLAGFFDAFDKLRKNDWFLGELIWCFADFRTRMDVRRLGGNRKGVLTRSRQPKAAAVLLRKRYWNIAHENDNASIPSDLDRYFYGQRPSYRDEL